jgi:hypothetical protein
MSKNNTNQIFLPDGGDLSCDSTELAIIDTASGSYEPSSPARPLLTYITLDKTGEHLNFAYFEGRLNPCLITLERRVNAYGSFSIASVANVNNAGEIADKIILSARHVPGMTDLFIVSCVLRQMVGIWQHYEGNPPGRPGFFNCEWYHKMRSVGLQPYAIDKNGNRLKGRKSGERFDHEVIANGPFDLLGRSLLSSSNNVLYLDRAFQESAENEDSIRRRERKAESKTRFVCSKIKVLVEEQERPNPSDHKAIEHYNLKVWGAPGAWLRCGHCLERMTPG